MGKSIKCECGREMKTGKIEIMPDLFSDGYRCQGCGSTEFTEEQMRKALKLKENAIDALVVRKLGRVGGSLVLRIPKPIENSLSLKSGEEVRIIAEKGRMIVEPIE